ncbi:MAG TPA: efflux RND transporter periplasmic adaptor subunit [Candidatus Dormibacteraeota bacterium]|nr:efflux RND transporter periplasmic adaptor subunit [Candidatus Dormibacteraeota bacterium]
MATTRNLLLLVLIASTLAGCAARDGAFPYSGTIQAEQAAVGSTVGGRIAAVLVSAGDRVAAGSVLVRFDDAAERAALAAAQGRLRESSAALADLEAGPRPQDVAKAGAQQREAYAAYRKLELTSGDQLAVARHQVGVARAEVVQADAQRVVATRTYARDRQLYLDGAISAQADDQALALAQQAAAALLAAEARLRTARAQLSATESGQLPQDLAAARSAYAAAAASRALVLAGSRPDQIAQATAAVATARANLAAARVALRETVVRTPADGVVESIDLRAGDLVAPGAAVATVDELVDPYVRIYVPQRALAAFTVGRHVRVRSDADPGRTFEGRVEQVDANAQFTPRNVQTAEDRADLVFGVKIRIHDPQRLLRGGTTAEVAPP